jgi:CubicO group peptidase (beta-lactamase class C family)
MGKIAVKRIADHMDFSFSGTLVVKEGDDVTAELCHGYANRSDQLPNNMMTRYGIASGCKLFTAIAICQLVEEGKLSFNARLSECLNYELPKLDKEITVHQLLTHTSGMPDYFDEEEMDDFEELWINTPMYRIRSLQDFLPLFQDRPMKFNAGERFHYNNAGYILLGLIVEQASQQEFTGYIQNSIFKRAGMENSGYFEMDALPVNTALGYIDYQDGTWRTNIYSLPAKGGSDGGAYVTANDMVKLWEALIGNQLLSKSCTGKLLTPHVDEENNCYGYGVWIKKDKDGGILKYHVMGYDPGVSFHSAFYPEGSIKAVVCSNKSKGAFDMMKVIENEIVTNHI